MANDPTLALRRAIIGALKADSGVTDLVADGRVYGERALAKPIFPFIRYGITDARPKRGTCWDGATIDLPIHAFSKAEFTDEAVNINRAIQLALDGKALQLEGGATAYVTWAGSTVIPDAAEAGIWHGISRFSATTS